MTAKKTQAAEPADNLGLWKQVEETNALYVKDFNRGGGFRGTAINPTYLARTATEIFGPMGLGWGLEIVDEKYVSGAPLPAKEGQSRDHEIVHVVLAKLWYVLNGERGEIYQFGQTTFVGHNKYGPFTDEEAPKKSLTDAMSKCLSLLGFSADIHLGRWDDNKYVNDRKRAADEERRAEEQSRRQAANGNQPPNGAANGNGQSRPAPQPASATAQSMGAADGESLGPRDLINTVRNTLPTLGSLADLEAFKAEVRPQFQTLPAEAKRTLAAVFQSRQAELEALAEPVG